MNALTVHSSYFVQTGAVLGHNGGGARFGGAFSGALARIHVFKAAAAQPQADEYSTGAGVPSMAVRQNARKSVALAATRYPAAQKVRRLDCFR